jgi:hypothetical protein
VGVRETLNRQPAITTGATIGIILFALIFIIYQVSGTNRPRIPTKAYYTADDGATYFADDIRLIPPFDHDGKPAVKADVFKCAGGKEFVGYLERYKPDAKKKIEDSRSNGGNQMAFLGQAMATGVEVKRPLTGDRGCVSTMQVFAGRITAVQCPDGSTASLPEPVVP